MKPELKVKNEAKDWAEALGADKRKAEEKITVVCSSFGPSTSEILAKLWEEAETPREAMVMAFLLGLTEGVIRIKESADLIVKRFEEG